MKKNVSKVRKTGVSDYLTNTVKYKVRVGDKTKPVFKTYVASLSIEYINESYKEWKSYVKKKTTIYNEEMLNNLVYVVNELFSNLACKSVYYTKDKKMYIDVLEIQQNIENIIGNKLYGKTRGIKEALLLLDAILSFAANNKARDIEKKNDLLMFFMKNNKKQ